MIGWVGMSHIPRGRAKWVSSAVQSGAVSRFTAREAICSFWSGPGARLSADASRSVSGHSDQRCATSKSERPTHASVVWVGPSAILNSGFSSLGTARAGRAEARPGVSESGTLAVRRVGGLCSRRPRRLSDHCLCSPVAPRTSRSFACRHRDLKPQTSPRKRLAPGGDSVEYIWAADPLWRFRIAAQQAPAALHALRTRRILVLACLAVCRRNTVL